MPGCSLGLVHVKLPSSRAMPTRDHDLSKQGMKVSDTVDSSALSIDYQHACGGIVGRNCLLGPQEVRVLSSSNWRPINARLEHSANVKEDKKVVIYTEDAGSTREQVGNLSCRSRYVVQDTPIKIHSNKAPAEKPNPKIGVGTADPSSAYLLLCKVLPLCCTSGRTLQHSFASADHFE